MDAECPQRHHLHDQEKTHCGEINCTCDCLLCVRRRAFWDQAAAGHYKVIGGPGDGMHVTKSSFPALKNDGDKARFVMPDTPSRGHIYEKRGNELHHVDAESLLVFVGGPYDSYDYPSSKLTVKDGAFVIFPRKDKQLYDIYVRRGTRLEYHATLSPEALHKFNEEHGLNQPESLNEVPGLGIL